MDCASASDSFPFVSAFSFITHAVVVVVGPKALISTPSPSNFSCASTELLRDIGESWSEFFLEAERERTVGEVGRLERPSLDFLDGVSLETLRGGPREVPGFRFGMAPWARYR